jgi:hypothetical protein
MDADWGLTKRRTLPRFLALIQAHNAAYNRRLLLVRLVCLLHARTHRKDHASDR